MQTRHSPKERRTQNSNDNSSILASVRVILSRLQENPQIRQRRRNENIGRKNQRKGSVLIQIRINENADIAADQNGVEIRIEKASVYLAIDILREAIKAWENANPRVENEEEVKL